MCRFLVTGTGGSGMLPPTTEYETEDQAKAGAHDYVLNGYTVVRLWELRYKAAEDTKTVFTAPNGRAEVYERDNGNNGSNAGNDSGGVRGELPPEELGG